MTIGPYFVLKYFSFTFTLHLAYSDTHLQRHNLFGSFDDVLTEFDCTCKRTHAVRLGTKNLPIY